jgi:autotransporter-associated beta strand protein
MKKTLLSRLTLLLPILPASAGAAEISKLQNNTALNLGGAWNGGGVPGLTDVMLWDSLYTAPGASSTLSQLGGDLSVQGLKVTNVGGALNAAATQVGFQNTGSANTLTIGSAGIDLSSATQALTIQSRVTLGSAQTWTVPNVNTAANPQGFNNGEDLGFAAQAAGVPFNLGGFAVNTSGAGHITFTSGHTISNGTINVGNTLLVIQGGGSRLETVNNDVTLNVAGGSILHFQSNSGAVTSNANIGLNGGTLRLTSNNATQLVTVNGTTTVNSASTLLVGNTFGGGSVANATGIQFNSALSGSAPLAITNSASTASVLVMGGNNSAYSGALTFGGTAGRISRLTTANSGSAAAIWNVNAGHTLQLHGVGVGFGTLSGAGAVTTSAAGTSTATVGAGTFSGVLSNGTGTLALTKDTAGTLTLTGANTYTGATQVNAGTLITTPAQTGSTSVDVAAAGTFGVRLATAGTTFTTSTLTTAASGATMLFDNGTLSNPTAPIISAATFNPAAGTVLRLAGTNFATGTFTLVDYTTIGGGGYAGLSAVLPSRLVATLQDNVGNSSVDLQVVGSDTPKWQGNISANWDIDDGTPTGTLNWRTALTNTATRYLQDAPTGTDAVIFDDTASGPNTNVNLTTTLTPAGITVDNTAVPYIFSGSGKLSGPTGITKSGTGTLTVLNTTANDYTGITQINAGTVQVGDGATAGAGSLGAGPVVNNGTLVANRPDGLTVAGALSGTGSTVLNHPLTTTGGGNFAGTVSGGSTLTSSGGTLQLSGPAANTNTAVTTVSAGLLQLNKTAGVNAVGGNINITGAGQLAILAGEQIPDTATINFTGTSTDSIPTQAALETVANAIVNSSVAGAGGGQIIMRNGFTITGTGTVNSGILGVASSHTGNVNGINITAAPGNSALVRIAGSGGPSVLNVGAGGITASGGEIQVKFNTNNQDATLNLGGDFTATGNVAITNAGYTGANVNVINLTATRTFDIAAGTTTTVAPDIGGPGGLTKSGDGILALTTLVNGTYTGITTINAGTLSLAGAASIALSPQIIVKQGATLDVSASSPGFSLAAGQSLGGKGTIVGPVTLSASSVLAPGESPGTLSFSSNLDIAGAVAGSASGALVFELDTPGTSDQALLAPAGALTIGSGLEFDDFSFSALGGFGPGTYVLFDTSQPISGTLGGALNGTVGGFGATLGLGDTGNDLVLTVVPEPGTAVLGLTGLLLMARRRRPV